MTKPGDDNVSFLQRLARAAGSGFSAPGQAIAEHYKLNETDLAARARRKLESFGLKPDPVVHGPVDIPSDEANEEHDAAESEADKTRMLQREAPQGASLPRPLPRYPKQRGWVPGWLPGHEDPVLAAHDIQREQGGLVASNKLGLQQVGQLEEERLAKQAELLRAERDRQQWAQSRMVSNREAAQHAAMQRQQDIQTMAKRQSEDLAATGKFWHNPLHILGAVASAMMVLSGKTSPGEAAGIIRGAAQRDWEKRKMLADRDLGELKSNAALYRQLAQEREQGDKLGELESQRMAISAMQELGSRYQSREAKHKFQMLQNEMEKQFTKDLYAYRVASYVKPRVEARGERDALARGVIGSNAYQDGVPIPGDVARDEAKRMMAKPPPEAGPTPGAGPGQDAYAQQDAQVAAGRDYMELARAAQNASRARRADAAMAAQAEVDAVFGGPMAGAPGRAAMKESAAAPYIGDVDDPGFVGRSGQYTPSVYAGEVDAPVYAGEADDWKPSSYGKPSKLATAAAAHVAKKEAKPPSTSGGARLLNGYGDSIRGDRVSFAMSDGRPFEFDLPNIERFKQGYKVTPGWSKDIQSAYQHNVALLGKWATDQRNALLARGLRGRQLDAALIGSPPDGQKPGSGLIGKRYELFDNAEAGARALLGKIAAGNGIKNIQAFNELRKLDSDARNFLRVTKAMGIDPDGPVSSSVQVISPEAYLQLRRYAVALGATDIMDNLGQKSGNYVIAAKDAAKLRQRIEAHYAKRRPEVAGSAMSAQEMLNMDQFMGTKGLKWDEIQSRLMRDTDAAWTAVNTQLATGRGLESALARGILLQGTLPKGWKTPRKTR